MNSGEAASGGGAEETPPCVPSSPGDLLRVNAGRILGDMLDEGFAGMEREGDNIGPYQLCEIIGAGGFGNVWRAEQTEVVKREVALKVVKLGMDTAQVIARFNQERQALASLEHPNIATMLDAGVGPNGRPYFAMEFVRGGSITRWCREHEVTLEERLRLFIQICQAVQHAHEKGILHRDIKPTNVLVTEVDGAPVPKVIDFGIAKAMHSDSLDDLTMLTREEQVIGTPVYMSPEQIDGGRRLDARSDVYALGTLLYEMLTGEQAFDVTRVSQGGLAAVRELVLETNPERPSTRLRQKTSASKRGEAADKALHSTLPADLDWITMKALEKDRLRRYQTAAELAADVQRHLENLPVLARPPSLTYKTGRWLRRHRRAVTLTTLGASASGIIAVGLAYHQAQEAKKPRPIVLDDSGLFTNDLGMKFVDVPGTDVLMCIHETRYKDFEAYAAEVPGAMNYWANGVERGLDPVVENRGDHPVMRVNWQEAQSFCDWLSKKERRNYRLPTDREWSHAVGIGESEEWTKETTPATVFRHPTAFPWGTAWPPPDGAGNFSDETRMELAPSDNPYFEGRTDGFATDAPVMSFKPNKLGIYDLSGNVSEWVEDWWDARRKTHALRGSSWNDAQKGSLLSSARINGTMIVHSTYGFRCVVERRPTFHADPTPLPEEKPKPPRFPEDMKPEAAAAAAVTNSLGMKLVPIPGTDVLLCIHETRRQDYLVFDKEVPQTGSALQWKEQQWDGVPTGMEDDHPVSGVNWHEARAFCAWLGQKEGRKYRLPTDREWSIAVGLGPLEKLASAASTPGMLSEIAPGSFPYGGRFPPSTEKRHGNYADQAHRTAFPTADILENYADGFATSAPVMSFPPNPLGLYDMGGNVTEWVEDWLNLHRAHRVLRGGSWVDFTVDGLRSNKRHASLPEIHRATHGFRIALEPGAPAAAWVPPVKPPHPAAISALQARQQPAFPANMPPDEAKARSISNTLGMKLVPVPGTSVLFCIHETRRQDYAAYAAENPQANTDWKEHSIYGFTPKGPLEAHPVMRISWHDAQAFCAWLSRKESRTYRLPTDREWSFAAGIGHLEKWDELTLPVSVIQPKGPYPWGADVWPPASPVVNYSDESRRKHALDPKANYVTGYDDGYPYTAPVMSFPPNALGIYDLGGNAAEWCEDAYDETRASFPTRGGAWSLSAMGYAQTSFRVPHPADVRRHSNGFRIVLEQEQEKARP